MVVSRSLLEAAFSILQTPEIPDKVQRTLEVAAAWRSGSLDVVGEPHEEWTPRHPARPTTVSIVDPAHVPKRGGAGNLENKVALVHSLAHIESWAIDLSWDIILRTPFVYPKWQELPVDFWTDWVVVAEDEARHFTTLEARLQELGSHYGALPAHEGLWESAAETAHCLKARLAIVHMVHEARGLDVTPRTLQKMRSLGDSCSADLLQVIYQEEITHVKAGCRWFAHICALEGVDVFPTFHELVRCHFRGNLKPPFNTEAREQAGMVEEYYMPLVHAPKPAKLKDGDAITPVLTSVEVSEASPPASVVTPS
eukprot:GGOE01054000.1.p1 GENE.GGOE01054000.1~~GGOE01054000.1.p1  ORF type:complete len:311 (-),score=85.76 GGOE01054000.1:302-1234(-)